MLVTLLHPIRASRSARSDLPLFFFLSFPCMRNAKKKEEYSQQRPSIVRHALLPPSTSHGTCGTCHSSCFSPASTFEPSRKLSVKMSCFTCAAVLLCFISNTNRCILEVSAVKLRWPDLCRSSFIFSCSLAWRCFISSCLFFLASSTSLSALSISYSAHLAPFKLEAALMLSSGACAMDSTSLASLFLSSTIRAKERSFVSSSFSANTSRC
mmetsp:Transcript_44385/g.115348  ORF Transcript_44385/g.115348 Transcript_44385/m.115348 type:complete len:211 (-) Transcript_44385:1235-1867(-)